MPTKNTNIVTNINFLVKTVLVPPWANFRKFGLLFNPPLNYNKLRILTSERLLHDMLHAACFLACCVLTLSTVHCFLLQTTFDFSFFLSRYLHRITTVGCFFCLSWKLNTIQLSSILKKTIFLFLYKIDGGFFEAKLPHLYR